MVVTVGEITCLHCFAQPYTPTTPWIGVWGSAGWHHPTELPTVGENWACCGTKTSLEGLSQCSQKIFKACSHHRWVLTRCCTYVLHFPEKKTMLRNQETYFKLGVSRVETVFLQRDLSCLLCQLQSQNGFLCSMPKALGGMSISPSPDVGTYKSLAI